MKRSRRRRRQADRVMTLIMLVAVVVVVTPLVLILVEVIQKGLPQLSFSFLTNPEPFTQLASGGGYGAGIRGTIKVVVLASVISIPVGILAAVYITEYGRGHVLSSVVRFLSDVMTGIPSIFVGIFVYTAIVLQFGTFSTTAGGVALAILMLPIVVRSAEEVLLLVPPELTEASTALGARRWQTVLKVLLPAAAPGLTTGVLLAVARAAGETAPLLLTAFGNQVLVSWSNWSGPESTLTYQVFQGSNSPFAPAQARAWTGALVLLLGVLAISLLARLFARRRVAA